MRKVFLSFISILCICPIFGQVGINTSTPSAHLEVVGDVKTDGSLFLEKVVGNNYVGNAKFLVLSTTNEIKKYDIDISKYGPINYVEFAFKEISADGLLFYDTKISTTDYLVSIQGYSYFKAGSLGGIMPHSLVANENIEGYQVYAYPNTTTNTWCLKAFVNNSQFQYFDGTSYNNTMIDLNLNLMIYRKDFITKTTSPIAIDMGDSETINAPLPPGF